MRKETVKFLKDVSKLELRFPVAEIARKTGFSKGNVSEYLDGKKEPSENFLKKFYEKFYPPDKKHVPKSLELGDLETLERHEYITIIRNQSETIKSQQQTMQFLLANEKKVFATP